ncbi:MAG: HPr-rel-A system PqqD family peptide chaperone [Magnetococcus sp. YQC-9]
MSLPIPVNVLSDQVEMPERFMACNSHQWLLEKFGESHILFNSASNDTHVLNELAIATLDALRVGPATLAELLIRLGFAGEDATTAQAYPRLLRELDLLGLIQPVDA